MRYALIYIVIINLFGFFLIWYDKEKAKSRNNRVRERTFFIIALLGGAFGVNWAMQIFHHKTQHKSFVFGIPLLLIINIFCGYYFLK